MSETMEYNQMKYNRMSALSSVKALALLIGIVVMSTIATSAQSRSKDPLSSLKRSIALSGGTVLTADQSASILGLITTYRSTRSVSVDPTLSAAYDALDTAILAGDQATIQTQVAIIATRKVELGSANLQAVADFEAAVVAILRTGGQLDKLTTRYGNYRTLEIIGDLIGYDSHHDDDDDD